MATHKQRMDYVDRRMRGAGIHIVKQAQVIAREEDDDIGGPLLLALSMRESGIQNILNPSGTDRGAFQINDVAHRDFLSSVPGCRPPSWNPLAGHKAITKGMVPTFTHAARYAVKILQGNRRSAAHFKVPSYHLWPFIVAAYNCGPGGNPEHKGAIDGLREGNVDKYTTGGDYSKDVLLRAHEVREWLQAHPHWSL